MIDSNLETTCPWGHDVTHLDVHRMTGDEKMWFAREVNQRGGSVSKLAKTLPFEVQACVYVGQSSQERCYLEN